jgi:putative Mg2+ transporter-C (MgtC) family protein
MLPWNEIVIRLGLAAFFGAVIGIERERKDWAAGMRTHMMVCLGSSLTMMVSAFGFSDVLGGKNIVLDPSRVAAQVISGIGFIGAGTILFLKQGVIRGLTTASGLWTVAAIGLATGSGMYFAAGITTVLAIIILWMLQPLERRFSKRFKQNGIRIIAYKTADPSRILEKLTEYEEASFVSYSLDKTETSFIIQVKFDSLMQSKFKKIFQILQSDPEVKEVSWNKV